MKTYRIPRKTARRHIKEYHLVVGSTLVESYRTLGELAQALRQMGSPKVLRRWSDGTIDELPTNDNRTT